MPKVSTKRLTNGFEIPVYGLGTWMLDGTGSGRNPDADIDGAVESLRMALDQGITHIDTAQLYGDGQVEEIVGLAIKGYARQNLFICSKVRSSNLAYDQVIEACNSGLERTGAGYFDLYLIHARKHVVELRETVEAMNELVDRGLTKYIGVSNFTKESLQEAQSYSRHPIVVNQVHYNLIYRQPEVSGLLEYCQQNNVILEAWRPVELGQLSGLVGNNILLQMAEKYSKTAVQIAINWLISQPNVVTIAKTRSKQHLLENLGALDWKMDPTDIELLRKEFPDQQTVSDAVPLG